MNARLALVLAAASLAAACTGGVGSLGTLSPAGSSDPSMPIGSADATPQPGSPTPSLPGSSPSASGQPGPGGTPPAPAATPSTETSIVRAYFYLGGGEGEAGLVPVLREIPRTQAVARAAMEELIAGPEGRELADGAGISTAVPTGTKLLGLSIAGGTATVDLSGEFESGGGSASTLIRLGQVTYTLTQFPTVDRVVFRIDGETVTVFGSEGIVLSGPQTRESYRDLLPRIFVDRPAWGAAVNNPGEVSGLANVFEAQFNVELLDQDGQRLREQSVMATCGTGCWGTFDVTLEYDVDEAQWGTLRVFDLSEQDGSMEAIRDYPVWLTPAD